MTQIVEKTFVEWEQYLLEQTKAERLDKIIEKGDLAVHEIERLQSIAQHTLREWVGLSNETNVTEQASIQLLEPSWVEMNSSTYRGIGRYSKQLLPPSAHRSVDRIVATAIQSVKKMPLQGKDEENEELQSQMTECITTFYTAMQEIYTDYGLPEFTPQIIDELSAIHWRADLILETHLKDPDVLAIQAVQSLTQKKIAIVMAE